MGILGVGGVQAGLDKVLALGLRDQWLELGRGKGVHMSRLRGHQQQHLRPRQSRQLVGLLHDTGLSLAEGNVSPALIFNVLDADLAAPSALLASPVALVVRLLRVLHLHGHLGTRGLLLLLLLEEGLLLGLEEGSLLLLLGR